MVVAGPELQPEHDRVLRDLVLGMSARVARKRLEIASAGRVDADDDDAELVQRKPGPQVPLFGPSRRHQRPLWPYE